MVTLWGLTLTFMAAAHTFHSLLFARFWLGAFEASIAPSFVAVTQMFWRRREQPLRMSYWYAMNGFTGVVSYSYMWDWIETDGVSLGVWRRGGLRSYLLD